MIEINTSDCHKTYTTLAYGPLSRIGQYLAKLKLKIRECGSALYVGLARAVPPTNTNFQLTFLLTRLQEALYEDLPV